MIKQNKWLELIIPVKAENEDAISNFLFEIGCLGCHEINNELHSYFDINDWHNDKFRLLNIYLNNLSELGFGIDIEQIKTIEIADKDWHEIWKRSRKPIFITPDFIIKPTWFTLDVPENSVVIEIDPQMAFGSGEHETTQLMLKLMKLYLKNEQYVLDIGTGSGILAIAAVKLMNCRVIACDIDPIAVLTAKENAEYNSTGQNIHFYTGSINSIINISFDLILANINRKEIEKLLPIISGVLKPGGFLILSGILNDEDKKMGKILNKFNFKSLTKLHQSEWLGFVTCKLI